MPTTIEGGLKRRRENHNNTNQGQKKKETKEVFMDSRESRSLFASWASELSDHSFNCLLLALRLRAPPPCENFSCRTPISLTLQGRVPLPPRGTLFSCKQALGLARLTMLKVMENFDLKSKWFFFSDRRSCSCPCNPLTAFGSLSSCPSSCMISRGNEPNIVT